MTLWEEGHIVDKGRGKSIVECSRGVYDPINHHHTIAPTPVAAQPARPSSAPHQRSSTAGSDPVDRYAAAEPANTRHRVPAQNQGRYNPLTHTYAATPVDGYAARRDKEFERANIGGLGVRPQTAVVDSTFDPIQ